MHYKIRISQYILILFLLSGLSCSGQKSVEKSKQESDLEIEIIAKVIPKLLFPSPPPPPPPFNGTATEKKQFDDSIKIQIENFKLRVDSTEFYLYMSDSLFIPNEQSMMSLIERKFNGLAKKLQSEKLKAKSLNISLVGKQISYSVLPVNKWEEKYIGDFGYLGIVRFSRFVFNKNSTRAVFYYERYYDGLDAIGLLIHVKKRNGVWEIIENDTIWMS